MTTLSPRPAARDQTPLIHPQRPCAPSLWCWGLVNPTVAHVVETEDGVPRVIATDAGPVRVAVCRAWLSDQFVDIPCEPGEQCPLCTDLIKSAVGS